MQSVALFFFPVEITFSDLFMYTHDNTKRLCFCKIEKINKMRFRSHAVSVKWSASQKSIESLKCLLNEPIQKLKYLIT